VQLKEEKQHTENKLVPLENKKFGFEVTCRNTKMIQTPEQVLALYLGKLKAQC
jgi:hypothetical protein